MDMINLKDISVKFTQKDREVVAVDNVSLKVDKGDIYGIVGYSGAGKSTLVRVINLLQKPTQGDVSIEGKNLVELSNRDLREERKKIGMIFQHFNLMASRTIADNVAFPLKGSG
jgi:D-methionine transport system ATP-binding protein